MPPDELIGQSMGLLLEDTAEWDKAFRRILRRRDPQPPDRAHGAPQERLAELSRGVGVELAERGPDLRHRHPARRQRATHGGRGAAPAEPDPRAAGRPEHRRPQPHVDAVDRRHDGRRPRRNDQFDQSGLDAAAGLAGGGTARRQRPGLRRSRRARDRCESELDALSRGTAPQADRAQHADARWRKPPHRMERGGRGRSPAGGRPRRHRRARGGGGAAQGRGRAAPFAEDGGDRPAHRRHRARLQQHADRHHRLDGGAEAPHPRRPLRRRPELHGRRHRCGQSRGGADASAAGLRPAPAARSQGGRRQSADPRHGGVAEPDPGRSDQARGRPRARGLGRRLTDAHQLENAILNLAINARDAMPKGGTLSIATTREVLDAQATLRPGGDRRRRLHRGLRRRHRRRHVAETRSRRSSSRSSRPSRSARAPGSACR